MKSLKYIIALISVSLVFSCQKQIEGPAEPLPAFTRLNVAYGSDALQTMDVYLPAGRTSNTTKVMILVHGGAWNTGDKSELTEYIDSFKKRKPDFAYFNINYRLATSSSTLFPTQENDVKAAVAYIYNNLSEYVISNKFVLTGVSAGGHLSLLQAYKQTTPVKVKAVISFFGPTDMRDMYNNPANPLVPGALLSVMGATPNQDSLLYANSSPVNFVAAGSPPTMLLHGGIDNLVKPVQSTSLQAKLQAAGVTNQYVFYPTEGHGWFGAKLSDSFDKIEAFINANVQ